MTKIRTTTFRNRTEQKIDSLGIDKLDNTLKSFMYSHDTKIFYDGHHSIHNNNSNLNEVLKIQFFNCFMICIALTELAFIYGQRGEAWSLV